MSSYISDGSNTGQQMHIICDACNAEVVVPVSRIKERETSDQLFGWRHGIGLRDLCPGCQSRVVGAANQTQGR